MRLPLQRIAILLVAVLALAGCTSANVTGRVLSTGETFSGTEEPGLIGGSALSLKSSKGTKCEGRTVGSESVGSSVAVITCDDGRAGSVVFLDGTGQSVGTGVLGSDQLTLTIEK